MISDLGSIILATIRVTKRAAWHAGCEHMTYKKIPAARAELRRLGFRVERVIVFRE